MLSPSNTNFLPPFPQGIIVNDGRDANVEFVKGKTYRFRIISFAALGSAMLHFDSHTMQVIMNDGSYVKKHQAYQLRIAPAQRYDVLISAINSDHRNYPFLVSLDVNPDFTNPNTPFPIQWPFNFTGYLIMQPGGELPQDVVEDWHPVDDSHFEPLDDAPALAPVTKTIVLDFNFCFDKNGIPR
jgi:iron transport multicopper oxidase